MTPSTYPGHPEGLRSGQVAELAGVNVETLRYYERRGLLADPLRSPGGHRLYPPETITLLRVIKAAQRLGFTLDEVAHLVRLGEHHHGQRPDHALQEQARAKLDEIDARIADLHTIRANLVAAIDAGCDDLERCAETEGCPLPFEALAAGRSSSPVALK